MPSRRDAQESAEAAYAKESLERAIAFADEFGRMIDAYIDGTGPVDRKWTGVVQRLEEAATLVDQVPTDDLLQREAWLRLCS